MFAPLLEAEILLDFLHQALADFLCAVIGKDGLPAIQVHAEMTAFGGFEYSTLACESPAEFVVFDFRTINEIAYMRSAVNDGASGQRFREA